jgi:AraC-like DNA-binding protein
MDALSDVLRAVQLSGAVYLHAEFRAPWCVVGHADGELCAAYLPPSDRVVSYHLVVDGQCQACLGADRSRIIHVQRGDLLVVPQGEEHLLGSSLELAPVPAATVLAAHIEASPGEVMRIVHGGEGPLTRIICGFLTCDGVLSNPLLASLPRLFKVDVGSGAEWAWLTSALHFAATEAAIPREGGATVLAKLSELLFVQAIRHCINSLPQHHQGWLAALRDRYVGRAMLKLHADPARSWTVDELAGEVGLSRSALAQRFSELLGQPPMQYLAHWRLHMAARELRDGGKSLAEVALAVGYDSEPAFSRAFKREFGLPPASWRSSQRGEGAALVAASTRH